MSKRKQNFLCHNYIQMIRIVICIWMFSTPPGLKLYSQDMFPRCSSLSENNSNGCHSILYTLSSDSTADTFIAKPTVAKKHQSNSVSFPPCFCSWPRGAAGSLKFLPRNLTSGLKSSSLKRSQSHYCGTKQETTLKKLQSKKKRQLRACKYWLCLRD